MIWVDCVILIVGLGNTVDRNRMLNSSQKYDKPDFKVDWFYSTSFSISVIGYKVLEDELPVWCLSRHHWTEQSVAHRHV